MSLIGPIVLALPWIILPIVTVKRGRNSRSLDEVSDVSPTEAPLVSVIVPARNEERNIARCVNSVLASAYPNLEVIAVDDHSTDATAAILRSVAAVDARLRVVTPDALPKEWFGKQWACSTGASSARGEILAFFDADTWQSPDLIVRAVNAMKNRSADLLTVAGTQDLGTFWEKLIQPQIFAMMVSRYGGTEDVNNSPRAIDKIANGQCIFVRHSAYVEMNGHAAVRDKVAEDLAIAQLWFRKGRRTVVILGLQQLFTRMYTSLRELVDGWGKNVYAGGIDAMPVGPVGRLLHPVGLVVAPLIVLTPFIAFAVGLAGLSNVALVWGSITTSALVIWWMTNYRWIRLSPLYALCVPLAAIVLLYIMVRSIVRGRHVEWKSRRYVVQ